MFSKLAFSVVFLGSLTTALAARTMVVYNGCPFTVWPAYFTSGGSRPSQPTGWEAKAYTHVTYNVPDNWNGRIWARRNCNFSGGNTQPNTCATGGCLGGLQCATSGGTGVPPASLAEFNFVPGDQDYYDISNVDGSNLPIKVVPTAGSCKTMMCHFDLNSQCPGPLAVKDSNGYTIGCKSACAANLDGSNGINSRNCCSGTHGTPATCPNSGIDYYSYFHNNCPQAYYSAYDDKFDLVTCPASAKSGYTVTFCPP